MQQYSTKHMTKKLRTPIAIPWMTSTGKPVSKTHTTHYLQPSQLRGREEQPPKKASQQPETLLLAM
jgi:hypothetical protein